MYSLMVLVSGFLIRHTVSSKTQIRDISGGFDVETVIIQGPLKVTIIHGNLSVVNVTAPNLDLIRAIQTKTISNVLTVDAINLGPGFLDQVLITINVNSRSQRLSIIAGPSSIVQLIARSLIDLTLTVQGGSTLFADITTSVLRSNVIGAGLITVQGSCGFSFVSIRGSGMFNGPRLDAASTSIRIRGTGDLTLFTGEIVGEVDGSASVKYRSRPISIEVTNQGVIQFVRI